MKEMHTDIIYFSMKKRSENDQYYSFISFFNIPWNFKFDLILHVLKMSKIERTARLAMNERLFATVQKYAEILRN